MSTTNLVDPLANLRDYHLPPPVSWWPPAPGWWLLAMLLIAIAVGAFIWWRRHRRRYAAIRYARAELAALRTALAAHGDSEHCLRELSKLLRRFALTRFPQQHIAGLTGTAWLQFLDTHGGAGKFHSYPGSLLAHAPYQQQDTKHCLDLTNLVETWIRNYPSRSIPAAREELVTK